MIIIIIRVQKPLGWWVQVPLCPLLPVRITQGHVVSVYTQTNTSTEVHYVRIFSHVGIVKNVANI